MTDATPTIELLQRAGLPADASHRVEVSAGFRMHYVDVGQGEPVVFLHGFPEFWYSWRRQLPAMAAAGFRALAPDLPGFNESDRPVALRHYRVRTLLAEIAAFITKVAGGPAHVVGHDWGGVLAFRLAALYPGLVRKLVILNAPHTAAYRRELQRNPLQWLRSAYMLVFQIPSFAEWLLSVGDFALLERSWRREPVHPGAFSDEDIAAYKHAFGRPGGLTGPLNYYRAAVRYARDLDEPPHHIAAPTLVLWGEQDRYLGVRLLERLSDWVPNVHIERIADASHWVQNDVPDRVNQAMVEFLRGAQWGRTSFVDTRAQTPCSTTDKRGA